MSGLVGVISHRADRPVLDGEIRELANIYVAIRGHAPEFHVGGDRARAVSFGHGNESPGAEVADRSWAAWSGTPHHERPLVEANIADLDGQFSLIVGDDERGEVVVATDPFGMHALHIAQRDDRTYVSTSALALAGFLKASPSRLGLSIFLRTGSHFGPLTNWDGVERLQPGAYVRVGPKGIERGRYWQPEPDRRMARLDLNRAVDHALEVEVDTLRRHMAGRRRVWADLTGGFDSRLLNLLLHRAGVDFVSNVRDEERLDIKLSEKTARAAGRELIHLALPGEWPAILPTMLSTALAWGDANLEVLELSWVLWAHQELARQYPALLSSGGGELLGNHAWKSEFWKAGRTTRANLSNFIDMRAMLPIDTTVFAGDPTPEVRAEILASLSTWLEPYAGELNTTQLDMAHAYRSTGHHGMYHSADHAFMAAELPYYTKPGFVTMISPHWRIRNNHRLVRHMIERLNPGAAAVTTTKGGTAQPWRPSNTYRFLPYYGTLARKAVNKVTLKLGLPILPTVAHFDPAALEARRAVLDSLGEGRSLRVEDMRSAPLFDPMRLSDFLRQAREQTSLSIVLLGRILTVELALRAVGTELD